MPDLYLDVDAALSEVPVNIIPLMDDTDFKTREQAVAYNAAGMELIWHFTTTSGATTATVVTPTTAGDYDWNHQDGGMYTLEITASGGASINNDTKGVGWFTGVATGVLPWRGPTIGFRADGLNNLLIDDAFSATRGLSGVALPDAASDAAGGLPVSDAGGLDIDNRTQSAAATTNINAMYDGTGYTDSTAPASRQQIDNIGAASGGAISFAPTSDNTSGAIDPGSTTKVWATVSGTFADVENDAGSSHDFTDTTNVIDHVYGFSVGGGRQAINCVFKVNVDGNADQMLLKAWDFVGADWETIAVLDGTGGTATISGTPALFQKHTGTGSEIGNVYIRMDTDSTTPSDLAVHLLNVEAVNIGQTVGYALGRVWVNTATGTAGTEPHVNGTADNPVDSIADAVTISTSVGLEDMNVSSSSTVTLAADFNNYNVYGVGYTLDFAGFDIAGTHFFHASPVDGVVTTANNADHGDVLDSIIGNVTVDDFHFTNCSFTGTVTLGAVNSTVRFINCRSVIAGATTPIVDFGISSANHNVTIANWQNGIEIRNFNVVTTGGTDLLSISGTGQLVIASTCDGGTINLRGQWKITDNSGGAVTIVRDDIATNVDSILADTNELQGDWADGGRLDLILDAGSRTVQMTEGYAADGVAPTLEQMQFMLWSALSEFAISGTTITCKQLDGSTTAMTITLDDGTNPTSRTRAT